MRVLLDACILFPTVLRKILTGTAAAGGFVPLWSGKILAEWQHTAARFGPEAESVARAEIALLNARWPAAQVDFDPAMIEGLSLPDRHDRHVLAAAIAGRADVLLFKGRLRFHNGAVGQPSAAPFPSALVVWRAPELARRIAEELAERVWYVPGI